VRYEKTLYIQHLVRFETDEDGSSTNLVVTDLVGREVILAFPMEAISRLIMTLPKMVNTVVQHRNPGLRVVYPLDQHEFGLSADGSTRILTLRTRDGFEVSFTMTDEQYSTFSQQRRNV
jgi:hypothetical protein